MADLSQNKIGGLIVDKRANLALVREPYGRALVLELGFDIEAAELASINANGVA
jgi:hypothetical protein